MARRNWHILKEDGVLTLARRLPVRFDLGVGTQIKGQRPLRLAHLVRQDIWRALQNLRGFAPAVRVETCGDWLVIKAGGQVDGALARSHATIRLTEVLEDPHNRARWQRGAA